MLNCICRLCSTSLDQALSFDIDRSPKISQNLSTNKQRAIKQSVKLQVAKCSLCELVQLKNHPVPYYKSVIRASGLSKEMMKLKAVQIQTFMRLTKLSKKTKVVEIGSGGGEYLSILQSFFDDVIGLEYGAKGIDECKNKNLVVKKGFIDASDYELNARKSDAFFIFNFLEHIPRPAEFLMGIRNNLADKAYGVIEVPNYEYMLSKYIEHDYTPEHLSYFTKDTLKKMLILCGFQILSLRSTWHNHILHAVVSVKSNGFKNNAGRHDGLAKILLSIERIIAKNQSKGVAIWGACHHSFFILSQMTDTKGIRFIVDSAPYKWNKFSPASGVKIVSPDLINQTGIETLIIIASSYTDEVAKLALQRYPQLKNIYGLKDSELIVIKDAVKK